jgi:hypothetical protein
MFLKSITAYVCKTAPPTMNTATVSHINQFLKQLSTKSYKMRKKSKPQLSGSKIYNSHMEPMT